jgi:3-phytase
VQTDHVPSDGDAADDPAIWVHPDEPEKSLVLGTDKLGALHVYDMDGRERQVVGDGLRPNNVDVLYGFTLGGRQVDLAVAECRSPKALGVKVWRIDPGERKLHDVTAAGDGAGVIRVFGGHEPYGSCTYRSAVTGKGYFFVGVKEGRVEQYELLDAGGGKVSAKRVRGLKVSSIVEGCVADDELGVVYIGEEQVGIWKFPAEPDGGVQGKLIAKVGEHGLTADVEGLTLYRAAGGKGYLIASSQGSNTFKVYERGGENRFLLTIDPAGGKIDDVSDTDGVAVTNRPTSKQFPRGVLVVQDGETPGGRQNFKLYAWEDIAAGAGLTIDTGADPRPRR